MRKLFAVLAVMCPLSSWAADDVVARIGGADVTVEDVRTYLSTVPAAEQAALTQDPALLSQAVRLYLAGRMVLKEARDGKFDQRAEIKAQLDRVRDGALAELYLQSAAKVPDAYPSDAEVLAAYEANKALLVPPRRYRLAQIFIAAPKDAKASAKLDEVSKALKAKGADFAALARAHSDNRAEAEAGGEIGWLAEPQVVPAIARAIAGLDKGAVSEPVRMDDGWHMVKLLDAKAAETKPLALAEVRAPLVAQLRQQKAAQLRQAYLTDLLRRNPPALNELALSKLITKSR